MTYSKIGTAGQQQLETGGGGDDTNDDDGDKNNQPPIGLQNAPIQPLGFSTSVALQRLDDDIAALLDEYEKRLSDERFVPECAYITQHTPQTHF